MRRNLVIALFVLLGLSDAVAQVQPTPSPTPIPKVSSRPAPENKFFKNIIEDQKLIWTSPFRLKADDAKLLTPLGLGTGVLIATDRTTSSWVSTRGSLPAVGRHVSWGGSGYATAGVAGAFYIAGRATGNYRARETGVLAAEALIDSGVVTSVLKYSFRRERPNAGLGKGRFFVGGQSFPSGHSTAAWSVATVIAKEYDTKPLVKYAAYTGAALVAMSRHSGRNHFLSDVLVGSSIGYLAGKFVYSKRHVPDGAGGSAIPNHLTRLVPLIVPVYDRRSHASGARLTWQL